MISLGCQFDNPDEATFCIKCGQRLRESKPLAYIAGAWRYLRPAVPTAGSSCTKKLWRSSKDVGLRTPEAR